MGEHWAPIESQFIVRANTRRCEHKKTLCLRLCVGPQHHSVGSYATIISALQNFTPYIFADTLNHSDEEFRWSLVIFFFPYLALWTQQGMRTSQEGRLSSFQEDTGYHLGGWPAWSQLDLQPRRNKQVNLKIVSFQKICSNIWQISLITVMVLKMYYTKPNSTNYSEESDSEQRMLLFNTLNEKALKIHLVFTLVSQCNDDVDFPNEFIVVSI